MAVDLAGTVAGGEFKAGTPQPLFQGILPVGRNGYDVGLDGRRFLILASEDQTSGPSPIVVILNWAAGLRQ